MCEWKIAYRGKSLDHSDEPSFSRILLRQRDMITPDARTKLLETALELVQTRGYNAFSYRDLAERVGIRTASIHYHFATKADLGRELVVEHRKVLAEVFASIDGSKLTALERLNRYCQVFRDTLENGQRMCLGGMLASDSQTLPIEVLNEVRRCYDDHEQWLTKTLLAGRRTGELQFTRNAKQVAMSLFDALEGAMIAARAFGDVKRLDATISCQLAMLTG